MSLLDRTIQKSCEAHCTVNFHLFARKKTEVYFELFKAHAKVNIFLGINFYYFYIIAKLKVKRN